MATNDVTIRLNAQDKASPSINQVKQSLTGLVSAQGVMGGIVGGLIGGGMMGLANSAMQAAAAIPQAVGEMANMAMQAERTESSFVALASGVGQSSTAMLAAMKSMTAGTVADTDLMLAANRAMMLGVSDNAEEMGKLMAAAIERGRALGVSSQQAVNDIITGIGRMSPMILDNLGIVGVTQSVEEYARSLGKTSDALTDVEKKQALVNAVIASGSGMAVKIDAASAVEQMQAAQANAAVAVGSVMVAPITNFNQGVTDMINILTGKFDEVGAMAREYQDFLIAGTAGDNAAGMQAYVDAANALGMAIANNLPSAEYYSEILADLSRGAGLSGDFGAAEIGLMRGMVDDVTRSLEAMADAAEIANRQMGMTAEEGARAFDQSKIAALAAKDALQELGAKIGWVGQMAAAASSDVASFNMNVASIEAAVNSVNAIVSSGKSKAEFLALDAISKGANPEIVKQMLENVTTVLDSNTYTVQNNTDAHIDNQLAVNDAISPLQNLVTGLDDADAAAKRLASQGLSASKQAAAEAAREFDNLKSKVSSMLQEGLSPDVSIADGILPRGDDINENARRLAAIANEGIGDQSWMEEFKAEAPGIFDEIVNAANPQAAAARIFQEFQLGLRPELMDKELIKQRIKDAILGEQKMDALATEIAQELSASMGISLPAALKAAQDALGVAPTGADGVATGGGTVTGVTIKPTFDLADVRSAGASAGAEFAAGMDAPSVANKFSVSFMLGMKEFYGRFYASGAASAGEYNSGFITQFKTNVPVEIVLALATLVTPEVLAAIDARNGRSGALP